MDICIFIDLNIAVQIYFMFWTKFLVSQFYYNSVNAVENIIFYIYLYIRIN